MLNRISNVAFAMLAVLLSGGGAAAFDQTKYPDWTGVWQRPGPPVWTPAGETVPLTPEYQAVMSQNAADLKAGGHAVDPTTACVGPGMPRVMNVVEPMQIVITPQTTYILISNIHDNRRIYTDGRDWPEDFEPAYKGVSIGQWRDTDGDGQYDTLEVETRSMKGPRAFDATGLPLHADSQTIVKERIFLDKSDRTVLWNEVTTIDHALTGPWLVKKKYVRSDNARHNWVEQVCQENNRQVRLGKEQYNLSPDGLLMPARKDQPPPDLRYFK